MRVLMNKVDSRYKGFIMVKHRNIHTSIYKIHSLYRE